MLPKRQNRSEIVRFVSSDQLDVDMTVGKAVYDEKGMLYLSVNQPLNYSIIEELREAGYSGIYVEDEISCGIELNDAIPYELRNEVVRKIHKLFEQQVYPLDAGSINEIADQIIKTLIDRQGELCNFVDVRNYHDYLYRHCANVGVIAASIGIRLGLGQSDIKQLTIAGLVHDIGMCQIDQRILLKDGKLTEEEYAAVKRHARLGYQAFDKERNISLKARVGIIQHHERLNGSGYPDGLIGEEISLYGKILAIADVYDALTSAKTYKQAISPMKAFEYLIRTGGRQFDLDIVSSFVRNNAVYSNGAFVKLSDGECAIVAAQNQASPAKPIVRRISDHLLLDLSCIRGVFICNQK